MNAVTAACGPVIYRGGLFPADFLGNAFICEPAGNLIKRIIMSERDGGMTGRNGYLGSEFLTSTDERFRPVNLVNGPDGALYIVDMYRGVIQHRTYVTTYLRKQIEERNLERPLAMGRIYRVVPNNAPARLVRPDLAHATSEELVRYLGDANGWVRDTAQRLLVENHDASIVPALRKAAATAQSPLGRLHALWTLEGLGGLDRDTILRALRDGDPRIASAAIRLAEPSLAAPGDAEIISRVMSRVKSPSPVVRLQLALSLGEMHSTEGDNALRTLAAFAPTQPYLADAIVSGLSGREELFVASLAAEGKNMASAPSLAVTYATSAVLKSGDAPRIEGLLSLAGNASVPAWTRTALLDGVLRIIPKTSDGKMLMASLPAEPTALIALAAQKDSPDSARAEKLLPFLKWPGKPGLATVAVSELTPAQKVLFDKGQVQYSTVCAACHQPNGQGLPGLALPLVNSRWVLGDDRALARIVLCGKAQENLIMPPMRAFDDETLAGVLTFIRRSWGHEAAPVSVATVAEARAAVAKRDEPWTDSDLDELVQDLGPAPKKASK
jgi:mono/diheme cytochrome c family protein